jgi:hypothetical protein
MAEIIPVYEGKYRVDGLFKCCDGLHYTPNRFEPMDCPNCQKSVTLSKKLMFEIHNNLKISEMV